MDQAHALIRLAFIVAMIVAFVGGFIAILMLWYARGRDPQVGLVAEIVSEPPDDLPPGAVGTLVDESADHNDVVATLFGLGRNGAINVTRAESGNDWVLTLQDLFALTSQLERDLLVVLFGTDATPGAAVTLSQVRPQFRARDKHIRQDLYRELVERGYFDASPEDTRRRWRKIAFTGLVVSLIAGVFLAVVVDPYALLAMVAALIMWIVMLRMARHMPRKTEAGAEASARWMAFKRYLLDLDKHRDLGNARELFDRYLPYAVALKIDRQWIREFDKAGARSPDWFGSGGSGGFGDIIIFDSGGFGGFDGGGSIGEINAPDLPDFDLQGASDLLGGGFQGMSEGLGDLLDSAGSIFDSIDIDFD